MMEQDVEITLKAQHPVKVCTHCSFLNMQSASLMRALPADSVT